MVFTRAVTDLIDILRSFQPLGGKPEGILRILMGVWTRVAEVVRKKQQIMSKRPASSQCRDSLSWSAGTIISQTGTRRPREGQDSAVVTQQTGPVAARAQHFFTGPRSSVVGVGQALLLVSAALPRRWRLVQATSSPRQSPFDRFSICCCCFFFLVNT